MAELTCVDLGRAAWEPTLRLQLRLVEKVKSAQRELAYLLLLEHDPPVITLGRRGLDEHVLASPARLAAEGIEVHATDRGGEATYHGPGQLVAYPIIRLNLRGRDVRAYVRSLEQVAIETLARFKVEAGRKKGMPGVWVKDEKIAAVGVSVSRWVTHHGLALNVDVNLEHFGLIVPCGHPETRVTSLSYLAGGRPDVSRVKPVLVECMVREFGFDGWHEMKAGDLEDA